MADEIDSSKKYGKTSKRLKIPTGILREIAEDTVGALGHAVVSIGQEMMHQIAPGTVAKPGHYVPKVHKDEIEIGGKEEKQEIRDQEDKKNNENSAQAFEEEEGKAENENEEKYQIQPLTGNFDKHKKVDRSYEPSLSQLQKAETKKHKEEKINLPRNERKAVTQRVMSTEKKSDKRKQRSVIGQMFYLIYWMLKFVFKIIFKLIRFGFRIGKKTYNIFVDKIERIFWKTENIQDISDRNVEEEIDSHGQETDTGYSEIEDIKEGEKNEENIGKYVKQEEKLWEEDNIYEEKKGLREGIIYEAEKDRKNE